MRQANNFNLPNVLTSLRILFIPVFAWLCLAHGTTWWPFICFALMMFTDKLDGDIARAKNLITDFGKIADPIADKALMITGLVVLNIAYGLPIWITVVIVVRELGITFWRMAVLRRGLVIPASKGGKIKTATQSLAVALYLLPLNLSVVPFVVMLIATFITVYTGVQYLLDFKKANAKN
ncbi:MAG: CDP-diacylglycerol--glycerol-3-phosphate 3-phosphatidyltransferase [Corynebacterium sp.]|nr:CDP-diacylglycerol--glycerol-3-phosphate 3-phosphatidyltransferase [Corynebacterium sp.]